MSEKKIPIQSLKLTAAVYAKGRGVVEYVKKHGVLPKDIKSGGFPHIFSHILHTRGVDLELTEKEQMVLKAILRSECVPGGMVHVIEEMEDDAEDAS